MSHTTFLLAAAALPGPLTVTNLVDADDLFNFTTGTPGSCQCELPLCNGVFAQTGRTKESASTCPLSSRPPPRLADSPTTGHHLMNGEQRTFHSNNCAYYSIGGGIVEKDGIQCLLWRADPSNCTVSRVGTNRQCSRMSNASCEYDVTIAGTETPRAHVAADASVDPFFPPWQ